MRLFTAMLATAGLLLAAAPALKGNQADVALRAAMDKEMVDGDLQAAIGMYKKIVANPGGNRAVAAKALLQMGQCYEKLGQADARSTYERLLRDYPDQSDQVLAARARLAALGGASSRAAGGDMAVRRLLSGASVDASGEPSPDGRFLSISDSSVYPAIRDLETGQIHRFTRKDNWSTAMQILGSTWSPDGKNIAFGLLNKGMSM